MGERGGIRQRRFIAGLQSGPFFKDPKGPDSFLAELLCFSGRKGTELGSWGEMAGAVHVYSPLPPPPPPPQPHTRSKQTFPSFTTMGEKYPLEAQIGNPRGKNVLVSI